MTKTQRCRRFWCLARLKALFTRGAVVVVAFCAVVFWALAFLPGSSALAGIENAEPVERIIARVGNYPILLSELATQLQMYVMQSGVRPTTEDEVQRLQEDILQQLINERLFLIAAQQDTTLRISPEEIDAELDTQIDQMSSRFPSEQAFLDVLSEEGLTLRELRRKFYSDVENRILKERFVSRKLSSINVSRQEVAEFYDLYRDSIPDQPEGVRIAHVLLKFMASDSSEDSVSAVARKVRSKAMAGETFEELVRTYSAEPAGDLGYVKHDDVTEEFARVAFALRVGDISGPLRTQAGYHLLKLLAKAGDSVRVSQIFFPVIATASDSVRVNAQADSLLTELRRGASFAEVAKEFSGDDQTRRTEGELGWYAFAELPIEFKPHVTTEVKVGDIIGPISSDFGFHLIKILERQEAEKIDLENGYNQIHQMARRWKTDSLIDEWIAERRADTYIEIKSLLSLDKPETR